MNFDLLPLPFDLLSLKMILGSWLLLTPFCIWPNPLSGKKIQNIKIKKSSVTSSPFYFILNG